jgi:hypothetical protein
VFKVNTDGTGYAVLKHFAGSDGRLPRVGLTLAGGVLYGTTAAGGTLDMGTAFRMNTDGTGFKVLKHFTGGFSGPRGRVMVSGHVLYGTTVGGGVFPFPYGSVFRMNIDGTGYTVLKDFARNDGADPIGDLTLSGTTLYGTASRGADLDGGVVFSLTVPPPPPLASPATPMLTNGAFSFQIAGEAGRALVVEASTSLVDWAPIATNIAGGALMLFADPQSAQFPRRFYRLHQP